MPVLHNRVSNEMLRARMLAETEPRTTISFYKYFTIDDPQATRDALYQAFTALNVFGRVYLAREGINAQISVPESKVSAFRDVLYQFDPALNGLRLNIALDDDGKSFWVLRMKVRERIVADGIDDPEFNPADVGEYLKAAEVNAMLDDPDAVFIDMRNHYEYEVGHFEQALEIPDIRIYGDFSQKDRAAIVSLNLGEEDSAQVSDYLSEEYDIATRSGGHCAPLMHEALKTVEQGAVRFSFSHFNTEEQIDEAIDALKHF